jgi:quercetin dioxygenase-like cupin family protein
MKRIVTGWDESGSPVVLFEGEPPTHVDFGATSAQEIWVTDATPPATHRRDDPAAGEWQLEPPAGGTAFRLATYQPGAKVEMHATQTLDYLIVLSGELTLLIGEREIVLTAGDTVVQQETPHGWANRSSEPCIAAAVLVSTRRTSSTISPPSH